MERRRKFPKRRLVGILAAAAAFTVVGGVLSAHSARPDALDTVAAPPAAPGDPPASTDNPTGQPDPTGGGSSGGSSTESGNGSIGGPSAASGEGPSTESSNGSGEGSAPTAAPDGQRPPPRAAALVAHETRQLGAVVVDADGFTLYRFDEDSAGDSTCTGACASTWPPAVVDPDARLALEGVDTSKVGLIRRRDGTYQLTISSWPVYRFAGDSRPGTFTGHGIGDRWFAITPTGAKAVPP